LLFWTIYQKSIDQLNNQEFGPPDCLTPSLWKSYVSTQLPINPSMQQWSVAKLVSCKTFFHGVGSYLTSEILHRLDRLYNITCWTPIGNLSLDPTNILMKLAGIYYAICNDITFWYSKFDIKVHDFINNKSFYYRYLEVYRKKGSFLYTFKGSEEPRKKVYCFYDNLPNCSTIIEEKWKKGQCKPLTPSSLGVGPLAWCSKKDLKLIPTIGTSISQNEKSKVRPPKSGKRNRPNPVSRMRKRFKKSVEVSVQFIVNQ